MILAVICSLQGQSCPAMNTLLESYVKPGEYFTKTDHEYGSLQFSLFEKDPTEGNCLSKPLGTIGIHLILQGTRPAMSGQGHWALPNISSPGWWLIHGLSKENPMPTLLPIPCKATSASLGAGGWGIAMESGMIAERGLASALDHETSTRLSEQRRILTWPDSPAGSWRKPAASSRLPVNSIQRIGAWIGEDRSRFNLHYGTPSGETFRQQGSGVSGSSITAPWDRYTGNDRKPRRTIMSVGSRQIPGYARLSTGISIVHEQTYGDENSFKSLLKGVIPKHFPADRLTGSSPMRPCSDDPFPGTLHLKETSPHLTRAFWDTDRVHPFQGSILVDF